MNKKSAQKQEAIKLRQQGLSLKQISKQLGVAKSSVSSWVRDVELTNLQKLELKDRQRNQIGRYPGAQANRQTALEKRKLHQQFGREKAKGASPLHLAGCMLYWAEGAKTRNRIHFVNSDPFMVSLFARFLREEFCIEDDAFALYIHCHTHNVDEIERIENYWVDLLDLSRDNLRKTYIKQGSQSRNNVLYNGICTICVHRTDLVMQIYGAIQEYGGFNNPDWLF